MPNSAPSFATHPLTLVVDNDGNMLYQLVQQLRSLGCSTVTAIDGPAAKRALAANSFDLVVSDIHLPGETGLHLLRWVRAKYPACDVILTTNSPTLDTAIEALRIGAADYLGKPISLEMLSEMLSRLRRRPRAAATAAAALPETAELRPPTSKPALPKLPPTAELRKLANGQKYQIGPVLLDLNRFVVAVNGHRVDATPSELEILHYLCRHADRVVSAQELVKSLRGFHIDSHQAPEIIRPHISNLRRKLTEAAPEADIVQTVRGVGYMLRVPW